MFRSITLWFLIPTFTLIWNLVVIKTFWLQPCSFAITWAPVITLEILVTDAMQDYFSCSADTLLVKKITKC
uniref:Uncharacterized protein n=1 Tax=Arundo donax TaxID=35708 RepID=A0A0A9CNG7_ARUDO